jgi:hypothetical protein
MGPGTVCHRRPPSPSHRFFGLPQNSLASPAHPSPVFKPVGEPTVPDEKTPYVLALGPVGSAKSDWLNQQKIVQPIDIATMPDVNKPVVSTQVTPLGKPIAIDHF